MTHPLVETVENAMRKSAIGWEDYIRQGAGWKILAHAAFEAILSNGYAIVPVEPTEEMVTAGTDATDDYTAPHPDNTRQVFAAMLSSAPKVV